jgi:hypothetical protein
MPMTALNIEHDDFDAYMQNALPRSARWQLRKKFKATHGETLALTVVDDARMPSTRSIRSTYRSSTVRNSVSRN